MNNAGKNLKISILKLSIIAASMLALAIGSAGRTAAAGGGLTDGEYDCGGGYTYRAMGKVDIMAGQFRYRPYGDVVSDFSPYSMDGSKIQWGGPFGGLDDPPARIIGTTREKWGFNVRYQGNPSGLINTMSCHAPGM